MAKVLFENLTRDKDKLYLQDEEISLLENELSFNEIIFKDIFNVGDNGINSKIKSVGHENDDNDWSLEKHTHEILGKHGSNYYNNISIMKFTACEFSKEPIFSSSKFYNIYFYDCIFDCKIEKIFKTYPDKKIIFGNCQFTNITFNQYGEKDKIKNFELYGGTIKELNIFNNTISEKFYINKQYDGNNKITTIDKLIINNTIFKENFKLHNCYVYEMKIRDTDFYKNADFYKSEFKSYLSNTNNEKKAIYFNALNFKSLALFGECVFDKECSFKYVTFEGHSHFRGAHFKKGLDLDYTNIQKEMNFFGVIGLDSEESKKNTSQETYRILKHNFQKIGNVIEANKYHSLELDIHRRRTWDKILSRDFVQRFSTETSRALELLSDGFVSFFHYASSNHSRTWIVPIFWILVVGFFTNICMDCPKVQFNFMDMFKYISIANFDECLKNHYVIFFLNKISLGYLYYQFIIATRKNTKK